MKDSQRRKHAWSEQRKYIKANNERFSTAQKAHSPSVISISRRIMKDSQQYELGEVTAYKYIKANNERFSTWEVWMVRTT